MIGGMGDSRCGTNEKKDEGGSIRQIIVEFRTEYVKK